MWLSYNNDLINLDRSTSIFLEERKIVIIFSEEENYMDTYTMKFQKINEAAFHFEKIRDGLVLKRSLLIIEDFPDSPIMQTHQD